MIGSNHPCKGLRNPDDLSGFVCADDGVRNAQVLLRLDVLERPTVISLDGTKLLRGLDVTYTLALIDWENTHILPVTRVNLCAVNFKACSSFAAPYVKLGKVLTSFVVKMKGHTHIFVRIEKPIQVTIPQRRGYGEVKV
jgi:hypothetical protein